MLKPTVLLVDDDDVFLQTLAERIRLRGLEAVTAPDGPTALELARSQHFDLAIVDHIMPGMGGLMTITRLRELSPSTRTVLLTGHGDDKVRQAVEALHGDYFDKLDIARFWKFLEQLQRNNNFLHPDYQATHPTAPSRDGNAPQQGPLPDKLVGRSPAMRPIVRLLPKLAALSCSVLICGEPGTGKALAARTLHRLAPGPAGPFRSLDCQSFSSELVASTLFGNPQEHRAGLLQSPHGGILFLEAVDHLPRPIQERLLRTLQEEGGLPLNRPRLVASTTHGLAALTAQGRFDEALAARLSEYVLELPPLRERKEDLPLLAHHCLRKVAADLGRDIRGLSPEALALLQDCSFPGNIPQLQSILEQAALLCPEGVIQPEHLQELQLQSPPPKATTAVRLPEGESLPTLAELEDSYIRKVMDATGGNRNAAAEILGISRSSLWRKLKLLDPAAEPADNDA